MKGFEAYVGQFREMSGGAVFWFIFIHNVMASLLLVGAGLLFGIIPTAAICFNGFMLGVVYRQESTIHGYAKTALELLPNGIFEIPALLVSAGYGLWLGVTVIRRIQGKTDQRLRDCIEHAFRRYFTVALPLLVVAAGIETYLMLTSG